MKITLLDNFDSFTYNLVDQFRCLGFDVSVFRNDTDLDFLSERLLNDPQQILVLSPGPGAPHQAGNMLELLKHVAGKVPILGICLGHQALVEHYGGKVSRAPVVVHGKASQTFHNGEGFFANLPSPLSVARYHSLVATEVPDCLQILAVTDGLPMAVYHPEHRAVGYQFHPESILTTLGSCLLSQTLQLLVHKEIPNYSFIRRFLMSQSDILLLLDTLYAGDNLSRKGSEHLFSALVAGRLTESQITAALIALKLKGESIDEISGAVDALRNAARPFPHPRCRAEQGLTDIVGTGGDGHNTINISTTAAFVAAASGARVTKHGNRSVSSQSGSSDLLAELGVKLYMPAQTAADCVDEFGLCFLFAPHYHSGVHHAVPVRQSLKTRTLFNILGPLITPAQPEYMLLGVYSPDLVMPIAQSLQALGLKRAMVVHGDGLDEVAIHGPTQVVELNNGSLREYQLTPDDLGVDSAPLSSLKGGDPAENAAITRAILQGQGEPAHRDAVAVNAGCALYISGLAETPAAGTKIALSTLANGKGWTVAQQLAAASHKVES